MPVFIGAAFQSSTTCYFQSRSASGADKPVQTSNRAGGTRRGNLFKMRRSGGRNDKIRGSEFFPSITRTSCRYYVLYRVSRYWRVGDDSVWKGESESRVWTFDFLDWGESSTRRYTLCAKIGNRRRTNMKTRLQMPFRWKLPYTRVNLQVELESLEKRSIPWKWNFIKRRIY